MVSVSVGKEVDHAVQAAVAERHMRLMTHHRLGVVGNAHAGGGQHFQVIGAVARGKHLVGAQAQLAAQFEQPVGLGLRVDDVALDHASQPAVDHFQGVGDGVIQAQLLFEPVGEIGEAAGNQADLDALGLAGGNQFFGARVEFDLRWWYFLF